MLTGEQQGAIIHLDWFADGPLTVSGTNARYLVKPDGTPVYLAGFHTWYVPVDGGSTDPPPALDWDEFLDALVDYGCNFTKFWRMESSRDWSDATGQYFGQHPYQRTGPGNANDGKLKFDLTAWDQTYFDRVRARAIACGERGIYVCVQLFNGWQIELGATKGIGSGDPWNYHPYNADNNVNSHDGDGSDSDGPISHYHTTSPSLTYQQNYIEKMVDTLNDLDNVIWETCNEDTASDEAYAWQKHMLDYLVAYEAGKAKQHLVGITVAYPSVGRADVNADCDNSGATWVSYNATKADAVHAATDPPSMYDTDHTVGLTTTYSWVWTSLCEGHGGAWWMDNWDGALYADPGDVRNNATYVAIRNNLGYALGYTKRMDLLNCTPQAALSTSGFCLAKDDATDADYLVYYNGSGTFDLTLTTATGTLSVEWRRCSDGTTSTTTVAGGAVRTMDPPWDGEVVCYVYH